MSGKKDTKHASKLQETLCCISLGSSLPYNLEIMFQFRHRSCHLVSEKQWNGTTLREREDGNDAFWPKEEVINGLLSLLADHPKPRNIRKIVFLPLSQCVYYTFQKKRQENRCSILVDYTSCNRFWPNNAVKGKKKKNTQEKRGNS